MSSTLGAVRKTVLSSSKSSLSSDDWDMLCCGMSPAGMSMDAVEAKAEPACIARMSASSLRMSAHQKQSSPSLELVTATGHTTHELIHHFARNRLHCSKVSLQTPSYASTYILQSAFAGPLAASDTVLQPRLPRLPRIRWQTVMTGLVGRLTRWGCRVGRLGSIAIHAHAARAVASLGGPPHSHLKRPHLRHMADED